MKKLIMLCSLVLAGNSIQAQTINVDPSALGDMFRKPLIVEFPDTNARARAGVTQYPQKDLADLIKAAVDDLWKVNAKVEFEDQDEVKKNLERGDSRNNYLYLTKHPDFKKEQEVWVLNYSRGSAVKEGKVDYQIYLPETKGRSVKEFTKTDIRFIISFMQEHMKAIQKSGKVTTPGEYMYQEAEKNCKLLKERHILVDRGTLSKAVDEKALRKSFKKVNYTLADSKEIAKTLEENSDTCAYIFKYPGKFQTYTNSAFGEVYIFWFKLVVETQNYKVMGVVGDGRKDNVMFDTEPSDLKALVECEKKK